MESSGYAAAMATLTKENVFLAPFLWDDPNPPCRFEDGVLSVRDEAGKWHPIRAAFRYVTQKPWNRIPLRTRTLIINPIVACLAGGRNKMVAAKAYDLFNSELMVHGLSIHVPDTIKDVNKTEVPLWVRSFGGLAVIKVPYANAGLGVYTVTRPEELKRFMAQQIPYEKYIVQSLVGNIKWSTVARNDQLFHVGTVPNSKGDIYVADLRMMVCSSRSGFVPCVVYARRARLPLKDQLDGAEDSWAMLGTNLTVKTAEGGWATDSNRLLLMDRRDFNLLGIGIDDLIDAYVQTVLATIAIDKMAKRLVDKHGRVHMDLFASLNEDKTLIAEIAQAPPPPSLLLPNGAALSLPPAAAAQQQGSSLAPPAPSPSGSQPTPSPTGDVPELSH
jgi:hypothetical protein